MGVLNQIAQQRQEQAREAERTRLTDELTAEVETMRQGNDPAWLTWSIECRARWSGSVQAVASEWGIILASDVRRWLEGVNRLHPPPGRAAA